MNPLSDEALGRLDWIGSIDERSKSIGLQALQDALRALRDRLPPQSPPKELQTPWRTPESIAHEILIAYQDAYGPFKDPVPLHAAIAQAIHTERRKASQEKENP